MAAAERGRLGDRGRSTKPLPATVDRTFRLASVTKLLSTMAVLVAVEEGTVELDEPAGPPGSTVRLLLCHASGLPFEGRTPIAGPARAASTATPPSRCSPSSSRSARGSPLGDVRRARRSSPRSRCPARPGAAPPPTAPAARCPTCCASARELLGPDPGARAGDRGGGDEPCSCPTSGRAARLRPAGPQPVGPRVRGPRPQGARTGCRPTASPLAFGHFGQSGSFLWVDPDAGVACCGLSEEPFGDWARAAWPTLGDAVLARREPPRRRRRRGRGCVAVTAGTRPTACGQQLLAEEAGVEHLRLVERLVGR